ncbi:DUF3558 family protein [Saccharopolyspora thermophila]|nr:DUF3558 family protein [Saccharopolyspora subtropica]
MRMKRSLVAAAFAAVGMTSAACSGGQGNETPPTQQVPKDVLTSFDPCTVLSSQEIQSFGASPEGKPSDLGLGEVGCDFDGDEFDFGVLKASNHDEAYWQGQRTQFDEFTPNQVGGHQGFVGIELSGKGQGVCTQVMYVGKGSVIVDINYRSDKIPSDEATCAKAMEIARLVEPKLPK